MTHTSRTTQRGKPDQTPLIGRRSALKTITAAGLLATVGSSPFVQPAAAAIAGVTVEYKRCKVAFVSNASAIDSLAVYYADRDGERAARYGIAPTVTDPRGYAPLVVEYDPDADRTQIQLAEPGGALVHIVAQSASSRTAVTNPTDVCVPAGFNSSPSASFTATTGDSSAASGGLLEVPVGDSVTYSSTATDPDDPERLRYEWDLDDDGVYETNGTEVSTAYSTAGSRTVRHRVTDDFGSFAVAKLNLTVSASEPESPYLKLVPDALEANDQLGWSVAVGGQILVGGAIGDDDGGESAGAAYVYDLKSPAEPLAKLAPDTLRAGDVFGVYVATDGQTIVVGAELDDTVASRSGAAYVYDVGDLSSPLAKLAPDSLGGGDQAGRPVTVEGDTIVLGARFNNASGSNAGAVYLYDLADLSAPAAELRPSQIEGGDLFGLSVAIADGLLAIGAPGDDDSGTGAGAVYVYTLADLSAPPIKIVPPAPNDFADFGYSVAVTGRTVAVGAFGSGSVYVYDLDDLATGPVKVLSPGPRFFGWWMDTDGQSLVVAARRAGVWVYDLTDLSAPPTVLVPDEPIGGDDYAFSVSIVDGTVAVGARLDDDGGADAGAMYVFN